MTDIDGATDTDSASVTVSNSAAPAFRASATSDANTTSAVVTVPAAVKPGDQLVLIATSNTGATHTTPAGWTLLGMTTDGTEMRSSVFTRTVPAAGLTGTVRVAVSATSKTSLHLLAYSDAAPVTVLANAVQGTANATAHPAPAVNVATSGSAVLRYWADKASSARTWTTPAGADPSYDRSRQWWRQPGHVHRRRGRCRGRQPGSRERDLLAGLQQGDRLVDRGAPQLRLVLN